MGRAVQVELFMAGFTDSSGEPLAGGKVYSYEAGTSTAKALYTTQNKSANATNPVILDAQGRALVFGEGAYKFVIKDSNDVTLYTWDSLQYFYPDLSAVYAGTSTGSSNTYAVSPSPAQTAYVDGMTIAFVANHASSGAATLNVSSLGAKSFVKSDGSTALTTGDIEVNQLVNAQFVLSSNHFRLISSAGLVPVSSGGTGAATAADARTNLGLGTIATQNANNVSISGGSIAGITDLALADGGTGASTAANARTNLGLGTSDTLTMSSILLNSGNVTMNTSDGSDNAVMTLGHLDSTRGGSISLCGNEHASLPGMVILRAGAGSTVGFATGITTSVVFDGSSISPLSDRGADLGSSSKYWDEVYSAKFRLKSAPDYTVFNTAADRRSIDPTAVGLTVQQVAEIVDTIVEDLVAAGIFQ